MSFDGYQRKYSPTQPRHPAGRPQGGQWASVGAWSGHSYLIDDYVSAHGPFTGVGSGVLATTPEDANQGRLFLADDERYVGGTGAGYVENDAWLDPEAIEAARVEEERLATQAAWQETKERYFGDPSEHGLDYAEGGNPLIDFTPDDDQLREIGLDPDDPDFDPDDYYTIEAALMEHRFGSDYADMAQLVGAPNGARVEARWTSWEEIEIYTEHEFYDGQQYRTLRFEHDGSMSMYNHSFTLTDDAPPGLGSLVVQMQMGTAKNMGVTSVDVQAAGNPGGFMNGYYTWPRLGYDAAFGSYDRAKLASSPKPDALTVQDLFRTPGGAAWWKENGWGMAMTFNLSTPDALNRLDAYVEGKLGNAPEVPKSWALAWVKYAPGQARVPAGSPAGGQFAGSRSAPGSGASFEATRALLYATGDGAIVINRDPRDGDWGRDRNAKILFGRRLESHEYAALVGAPNGALVELIWEAGGDRLRVQTSHPLFDGKQERVVRLGKDGKPYIHNEQFALKKDAPPGMGTLIFERQVEGARAVGIERITLFAGGSPTSESYNGYYTWPRLGFNTPLRVAMGLGSPVPVKRGALPPEYVGLPDLHALFKAPGGAAWWKANGGAHAAEFDARPDSPHSAVLADYIAERQARVKSLWVKYNPAQPRHPAGAPRGGQWAAAGGGPKQPGLPGVGPVDTPWDVGWHRDDNPYVEGGTIGAGTGGAGDAGGNQASAQRWQKTKDELYGPGGTPPVVEIEDVITEVYDEDSGDYMEFSPDEMSERMFGRVLTHDDYAALVGAPNGSSVHVEYSHDGDYETLDINTSHPYYASSQRRIFGMHYDEAMEEVVFGAHNDYFEVHGDTPDGVGALVLQRQVEGLRRLGIDHIGVQAAGDPSNFIPGGGIRGMIGYYVWPRLGFNGEVLGHDVRHGPDWMSDIHDMHGIFAHPDGAAWWKENGWPQNLAFDTWAGSKSSDVLDRYIADKLAGRKTWAWHSAYQVKYSPTQPRNPAGTTTGGQFRSTGGGAAATGVGGGVPYSANSVFIDPKELRDLANDPNGPGVAMERYPHMVLASEHHRAVALFREAGDIIDEVHASPIPPMREIDADVLHPMDPPGANGIIRYRIDDFTGERRVEGIRFDDAQDDSRAIDSILHEYGHAVDLMIFGNHTYFGSDMNPRVDDVMDTIKGSDRHRILTTMSNPHPSLYTKEKFDNFIAYASSDRELFARAYMQWIVTKSSSPTAKGIKKRLPRYGGHVRLQWSDDDFAPIASAFDELFRSNGLLKAG
jgi:hypothetical protein